MRGRQSEKPDKDEVIDRPQNPRPRRPVVVNRVNSRGDMDIPPPGVARNSGPHLDEAVDQPGWGGGSFAALIRNLSHRQKLSLARSYIQLFGIFDKCRLWQVSLHKPISQLQALWPIEISRFWEGVGMRFPHATRLRNKQPAILKYRLSVTARLTSSGKFMLPCLSQNNLINKKGGLSGFIPRKRELPKPFIDCGGQVWCRTSG